MTKTLTYVFAGLVAIGGITAFAADSLLDTNVRQFRSREEIRKARAERPARKGSPSKAIAARVAGGTNGDRQLYGVHIYNEYRQDGNDRAGVVAIGDNGNFTYLKRMSETNVFSGCYLGDKLLVVKYDPWSSEEDYSATYVYYNTDTWEAESSVDYGADVPDIVPYGMTYDHTTELAYGSFFANSSSSMFSDDAQLGYLTGDPDAPVHIVGNLPERMRALAVTEDGTLYGLSFNGTLYTINKNTAAATAVTEISLPAVDEYVDMSFPYNYGKESMAVDWETGYFYISYGDNDGYESYISRFSADGSVAEMLVDYGYENGSDTQDCFTALYFKNDYSQPGVTTPAAVSDLSVKPVGTQLKAEVSFTLPSVATDNTTLSGNVDWTVTDGENELAKGQGAAGSQVSTTVEVAQAGNTTFVVFASIDGNQSRGTTQTLYVGPDVPEISSRPTVRVNGNVATVRWNSATGANGAAMEPVTYRVVRQPDAVVVAEATSETSLTDEITSDYKTCYVYEVTPVAGPMTGETVSSRGAWIGTYFAMPHTDNFTDESLFLEYPVIDNNKDNNSWDINPTRKVAVYHSNSNNADDYLLIGPFRMKAGNSYIFSMVASGHSISERVAVYLGTDANDVNSFKTTVQPRTDIFPWEGSLAVNHSFEPEADGTYWYGIQACSDGNSQYLYISDLSVRELGGECPAVPSDFDVEPGPDTATLRFTLPATNIDGSDCSSISEVRIYRDNVLLDAISSEDTALTPGNGFEYIDTEEIPDGTYRYSVSAVNAAGEGRAAEFSLYRGLDFPGAPRNLRIWEDVTAPGLIHVSFDGPERGCYGGYVNDEDITYKIDYMLLNGGSAELELGKGSGTYSFNLPDALTAQDGLAGNVYGSNSRGYVRGNWATAVCVIGPAIALPVQESWTQLTQRSGLWIGQDVEAGAVSGATSWTISDGTGSAILPQDGDGGELLASTLVENGARRIMSPRFTIGDAANPMLVFYYQYTTDAAGFAVEAIVDDQPVRTIATPDMPAEDAGKWIRCQLSLDEFKSAEYMQVAFVGRGKTAGTFLGLDNVTISDYVEHDLAVKEFTAPSRADINQEISFTLRIRNNGGLAAAAGDYTIEFVKNGEVIASVPGDAVEASAEMEYILTDIPVVTDPASSEYSARIAYADDKDMSNNASRTVAVRIVTPSYPTVDDLSGEYTSEGILLSWSDPGASDMPGTPTIESFESYPDFAISNIGDWTLYDRDGRPTVILSLTTGVLTYPHIGERMAWQVMDPLSAGIPFASWTPRTGDHMLVSFQACFDNARDVDSEDWLVSPELNGSEQNISFYARAGMSAYSPEIFDFMVSSTGNNVEDFTALASDVEVPYTSGDNWTEFVYKVPAGTRYFAIVHKSFDRLALLVDDITYVRAGSSPVTLELQGYNVYREGKLLNFSPVTDNEYVDGDVEEGNDYTYALSTLWDKGESGLSESVTVRASSGVGAVGAHDIRITAGEGVIRIEGGRGETVAVYSMDGICVASAVADGTLTVPVSTGFYVVRAGDAVVRVAVR